MFRFHHPKERRDAVVVRRVRVGAAFEQRQDDAWIVDRTLGSVPVPSVATVPTGRRDQRPIAVAVLDVRIGTRREQETHDFDRPVVGRLHQRRGPFAVLQIRIGPRVEQQPNHLEPDLGVISDCRHQRRGPPIVLEVGVGVLIEQQPHGVDVPALDGPNQRRISTTLVMSRIDPRPGVDQDRGHLDPALARRLDQRRQAYLVADAHLDPDVQQQFHHVDVVVDRGQHQRRVVAVLPIGVGIGVDQSFDRFGMPTFHCPHQRRHSLAVRPVRIGSRVDQDFNGFGVTELSRNPECGRMSTSFGQNVPRLGALGSQPRMLRIDDATVQNRVRVHPRQNEVLHRHVVVFVGSHQERKGVELITQLAQLEARFVRALLASEKKQETNQRQ